MRHFGLYLVVFICTALAMMSCNIDDSYDLSKLDDSNIGIGTDQSSFTIPLFSITISMDDVNIGGALMTKGLSTSFDLVHEVGKIDIDEQVLDYLGANLADNNNRLSLLSSSSSNLDYDMEVSSKICYTDINGVYHELEIGDEQNAESAKGSIDDIETLKLILANISIKSTIVINEIDPTLDDLDFDGKYINMKFTAYKEGSIKL